MKSHRDFRGRQIPDHCPLLELFEGGGGHEGCFALQSSDSFSDSRKGEDLWETPSFWSEGQHGPGQVPTSAPGPSGPENSVLWGRSAVSLASVC